MTKFSSQLSEGVVECDQNKSGLHKRVNAHAALNTVSLTRSETMSGGILPSAVKGRQARVLRADEIIEALALKHSDDVFVPECKDGPSAGASHFRMDAWAMPKSWSNWKSWGYEVKISRSDYQQDKKWTAYLPYCNEFYFVCPAKLIQPSEVPDPAGLMWVSSTGNRIFTKKKAAFRSVDIPEEVYRYILMCRAKITQHWYEVPTTREERMQRWREALAAKDEGKKIGRLVKGAITERQTQLECENLLLKSQHANLSAFRGELIACGINVENLGEWARRRAIDTLLGKIPPGLIRELKQCKHAIESAIVAIADEDSRP